MNVGYMHALDLLDLKVDLVLLWNPILKNIIYLFGVHSVNAYELQIILFCIWQLISIFRCEPFPTYPRTYDMLHAYGLISHLSSERCSMVELFLEMDRILRPEVWCPCLYAFSWFFVLEGFILDFCTMHIKKKIAEQLFPLPFYFFFFLFDISGKDSFGRYYICSF